MNSLVKKIDELIERQSLLNHPFYVEWSEGKLAKDSLKGYSKEYFQLVKAVPTFMDSIIQQSPENIRNELESNRTEEAQHVSLWINFAQSMGISNEELENYSGLDKTLQAVSGLSKLMNTFEGGAVGMYSFEMEIPKISLTKIEGLQKYYQITDEKATEYFRIHSEADIRHAATWRKVIEKMPEEKGDALFQFAKESISAQNLLLDGCYEAYC